MALYSLIWARCGDREWDAPPAAAAARGWERYRPSPRYLHSAERGGVAEVTAGLSKAVAGAVECEPWICISVVDITSLSAFVFVPCQSLAPFVYLLRANYLLVYHIQ